MSQYCLEGADALLFAGGGRTIDADATDARNVFAADLDGDGDIDVMASLYYGDRVVWYRNDGTGVFTQEDDISPCCDRDGPM